MNMYSTPAQAQFVNTFVPIPFDQLYQLGNTFNEDVLKQEQKLSDYYEKYGQFTSPSDIDTQNWYAEVVDKAKPIVDKFANNLDYIKTAEGRSEINSLINNVDREKLSKLVQSREGMLTRQKMNQELAARGLFNPNWHNVDFNNYDTLGTNQIYNDINPLAYKDIRTLSNPYYAELKDKYLRSTGGYNYYGIGIEDIERVGREQFNNISRTPEAQKHMEVYMQQNPGATQQDAQNWLYNEIVGSNLDRIHENREVDQYALLDAKQRGERAAAQSPYIDLTTYLDKAGNETAMSLSLNTKANLMQELIQSVENKDYASAKILSDKIKAVDNGDLDIPSETMHQIFGPVTKENAYEVKENIRMNYKNLLDQFTTPLNSEAVEALSLALPGRSYELEKTPYGKTFLLNDLTKAVPAISALYAWTNEGWNENNYNKELNSVFNTGAIKNAVVVSINGNLNSGTLKNPEQNLRVEIAIPEKELIQAGLANGLLLEKKYKNREEIRSNLLAEKMKLLGASLDVFNNGSTDKTTKTDYNENVEYTLIKEKFGDRFYRLEILVPSPRTGGGLNADAVNRAYADYLTGKYKSENYSGVQRRAVGYGR